MPPNYLPEKKIQLTDEPYAISREQKSIEEESRGEMQQLQRGDDANQNNKVSLAADHSNQMQEEDITFEKIMKGVFVEKLKMLEVSKDERRKQFQVNRNKNNLLEIIKQIEAAERMTTSAIETIKKPIEFRQALEMNLLLGILHKAFAQFDSRLAKHFPTLS